MAQKKPMQGKNYRSGAASQAQPISEPDTNHSKHWFDDVLPPVATLAFSGVVLLFGFLAAVYFLVDYQPVPEPPPVFPESTRVERLEAEISELQARLATPTAKQGTAAVGQDVIQQQKLLEEIRTELKLAEDRSREAGVALQEVRDTEQRTRAAGAIFLSAFAIVAGVIAGIGYFKIQGWQEKADEHLARLKEAEPDLASISDARATLETDLPEFLDKAQQDLLERNKLDSEALALMEEVEHLTYLGNVPFRFSKVRTEKQASNYMSSLLVSVRACVASNTYAKAIRMTNEFFSVASQYGAAVTQKDKARMAQMYAFRALANHQLMQDLHSSHSWMRKETASKISDLRHDAFADVRRAHQADPGLDYAFFVEALMHSFDFYSDSGLAPEERNSLFVQGQRRAAELYQNLINRKGRFSNPARQNLACCLKRIYARSGKGLNDLSIEVSAFPDDLQLFHDAVAGESGAYKFLWQSMLADSELFKEADKIAIQNYTDFWHYCLKTKIRLRDWKKDLAELRKSNPEMNNWEIKL